MLFPSLPLTIWATQEAVVLNESVGSTQASSPRFAPWSTPHHRLLTITWLISTAAFAAMLGLGVRRTRQYVELRYLLQAAYAATLLTYLIRTGPSLSRLAPLQPPLFPRWWFGRWISAAVPALLFAAAAAADVGLAVYIVAAMGAAPLILIGWFRRIRLRAIVQGLALSLIIYYPAWMMFRNGRIIEELFSFFLYFVPLMYAAGCLLAKHTGLGEVQLLAIRYRRSAASFFWGCLLFVPLGLADAAAEAPAAAGGWVDQWWLPLVLPLHSAIAEEIWFRLLLLTLFYFLMRPAFPKTPAVPLVIAVLFNGIAFGLLHQPTMAGFLVTGLLFGVPMAAVYARRDWEHAVGAHYMINMVATLMLFLETL